MDKDLEVKTDMKMEVEEIRAKTDVQMRKSRAHDYIALILALGTVFLLWLFQWMGLY